MDWEIRFSEPLATWLEMKGEILKAQEHIARRAQILQLKHQYSHEDWEESDPFDELFAQSSPALGSIGVVDLPRHTIKPPTEPVPDTRQADDSVAAETSSKQQCVDSTVSAFTRNSSGRRPPRTVTALQRELQAEMKRESERESERELLEQAERAERELWFSQWVSKLAM